MVNKDISILLYPAISIINSWSSIFESSHKSEEVPEYTGEPRRRFPILQRKEKSRSGRHPSAAPAFFNLFSTEELLYRTSHKKSPEQAFRPLRWSLSLTRYFSFEHSHANYSIISVTTPDPTVLPPSLIANLSPSSIAILWISSISIVTLSPGMHISVPAGNCSVPVISVVLK